VRAVGCAHHVVLDFASDADHRHGGPVRFVTFEFLNELMMSARYNSITYGQELLYSFLKGTNALGGNLSQFFDLDTGPSVQVKSAEGESDVGAADVANKSHHFVVFFLSVREGVEAECEDTDCCSYSNGELFLVLRHLLILE